MGVYTRASCFLGAFPPCLNRLYHVYYKCKLLYDLTTLCLNGPLSCVDFMDVTMGDVPLPAESQLLEFAVA